MINHIVNRIKEHKKNSTKPVFLYITTFDYHRSIKQRPQHILQQLSDLGYLIFWVTPDFGYENTKVNENYYVVTEDILDVIEKFDDEFVINLYSHHPLSQKQQEFVDRHFDKKFVIEHIDDFEIWKKEDVKNKLRSNFIKYCEKDNTYIITSADSLYNEILKYNVNPSRIIKSPNAVNVEDFQNIEKFAIPDIMNKILEKKKPIVGYYGALCDDWFDYDLCEELIAQNEYEFVFIGPISGNKMNRLLEYNNFTYIPTIKYEEIPSYAKCFDVATIPFLINDITKSTSPVKLYEYFAMGLPVVTTPMQECKNNEFILIGSNASEFREQIQKALKKKNDADYQNGIREFVLKNTWKQRAIDIDNCL